MSIGTKLLQAAAGNAGEVVYVDDLFSTTLYIGTDGSVVVPTGLDLADKGGMIWGKSRSGSQNHRIYDSGRGTQYSLIPNATSAQNDQGTQTFGSSSVTLGAASGIVGSSSYGGPDYVLWSFAKQEKFFDIVTFTGTGSSQNISHNLNTTPGMIIVKRTDSTADWYVWHRNGGDYASLNGAFAYLNATDQFRTGGGTPVFVDAGMTSTTFGIGTDGGINNSSGSYVAYLFGHNDAEYGENSDEAIIKCGSYTGNDGTQDIDVGFEPQWLLIKCSDNSGNWVIVDVMRGFIFDSSADSTTLQPNTTNAESSSTAGRVGPRPNGFGFINESGVDLNAIRDYIYVAIRRPHKPASEFAATDLYTAAYMTSGPPLWNSNFPVDSGWYKQRAGSGSSVYLFSRLTDGEYMQTHSNGAEASAGAGQFDFQDGWYNSDQSATTYISWMFRRAKGFFDVVAYKSNTTYPNTFNHNLGVVPELILIKRRDGSSAWAVYSSITGNTKHLVLSSNAGQSASSYWNNTTPTSTAVTVGGQDETWGYGGYTYIAYLFATVAGISKVGTYTGTGSDLNVDCGFSAGARFVLIKRTDSTGDWYLFDSLRGIVAGNDEYALLNTAAADVTNTDYIDPLSSGFTVTSSAPAGLNASSGTYIFLAIA